MELTCATLVTEEYCDVMTPTLTRADSHQTLIAVRVTVTGTDWHVDHRTLTTRTTTTTTTRTSSTTATDWTPSGRVNLTDLTN